MATKTITQLHRIIFSRKSAEGWDVVTFEADDLGQETQASFNIGPRKAERTSSVGTTSKPIPGTFNELTASVVILADYWRPLGEALGVWKKATYTSPDPNAGSITGGANNELCGDGVPVRVIIQGLCDDGSTGDVEFSRCFPSIDDDIEIGSSETQEITISLNPQIYNAATMSTDGYPAYTYRLGDADTAENKRFDVTEKDYKAVSEAA